MRIEGFVSKVIPKMSKSQAKKQGRRCGYEITLMGTGKGIIPGTTIEEIFVLKTALGGCPITRRVKVGDCLIIATDKVNVKHSIKPGAWPPEIKEVEVFEARGMEREGKKFGDRHLYQWMTGQGCPVGEMAEDVAQCDSYDTGIYTDTDTDIDSPSQLW